MINDRGATLVEVLVAMVLLAIGLLGAVGFSQVGSQALFYGDRITQAAAFVQTKMEDELGRSFADLASDSSDSALMPDGIRLAWKVSHDDPFKDMLTIEVVAGWTDARGKEKRISFIGVKTNHAMPEAIPPGTL